MSKLFSYRVKSDALEVTSMDFNMLVIVTSVPSLQSQFVNLIKRFLSLLGNICFHCCIDSAEFKGLAFPKQSERKFLKIHR